MKVPDDFEVKVLGPDEHPPGRTTCHHCNLSWDDDIGTGLTPAPSARCPFEYYHEPSVDIDKSRLNYVNFLTEVVIPDLRDSEMFSMAEELTEAARLIRYTDSLPDEAYCETF